MAAEDTPPSDGLETVRADGQDFDECITSLDELIHFCLDHPDRRTFVFIDHGSARFDARTHSHEAASQFAPPSKSVEKLSVDSATIGRAIRGVHPAAKRQPTTAFSESGRSASGSTRPTPTTSSIQSFPIPSMTPSRLILSDPNHWPPRGISTLMSRLPCR